MEKKQLLPLKLCVLSHISSRRPCGTPALLPHPTHPKALKSMWDYQVFQTQHDMEKTFLLTRYQLR
jgi:hypothetical protein